MGILYCLYTIEIDSCRSWRIEIVCGVRLRKTRMYGGGLGEHEAREAEHRDVNRLLRSIQLYSVTYFFLHLLQVTVPEYISFRISLFTSLDGWYCS